MSHTLIVSLEQLDAPPLQIAFEAHVPPMALVRYVLEPLPDSAPASRMAHVSSVQILNAVGEGRDWQVLEHFMPELFKRHTRVETKGTQSINLANQVYDLSFNANTGELKVLRLFLKLFLINNVYIINLFVF